MNIIEIKNLSKFYNQAHEQIKVLEEVFLNVKKGEFVSIIGPSGSGKSTLLNIIGLMDSIFSGNVLICGRDISFMSEDEKSEFRIKKIGFVFQFDSLLGEFNVLENVDMPARIMNKSSLKVSMELLKKFSLEKLSYKMPNEISGGEKQRVAILRALRNSPEILIADEPTGNLDKNNANLVLSDLARLHKSGLSIIMVTHNEELASKYCDSIYRIESSKLIRAN
jgi:ABC-type lipoprotein export system ATPase subunit